MTRAVGVSDPVGLFEVLAGWGYETFVVWANTGTELGRFGAADAPELARRAALLQPGDAVPYWDVAAVHPDDNAVVDHLGPPLADDGPSPAAPPPG